MKFSRAVLRDFAKNFDLFDFQDILIYSTIRFMCLELKLNPRSLTLSCKVYSFPIKQSKPVVIGVRMPATVLCLGAVEAGKTTFLRRLQAIQKQESERSDEELPLQLQPTTGISHYAFQFKTAKERRDSSLEVSCLNWQFSKSSSGPNQLLIKEFGGSLAPAWIGYLRSTLAASSSSHQGPSDIKAVLFAIDLSNPAKLAESGVHLVEVLQFVKTADKEGHIKFLILFTKADLVENLDKSLRQTEALLRLNFLSQSHNFNFEVLTISSETDFGLCELEEYLTRLLLPSQK